MGIKYRGGQNFRVLVPTHPYGTDPSNSNAAYNPPVMRSTMNFAHGIQTPGAGLNAHITNGSYPIGLFEVVYGGGGGATDSIVAGSVVIKLGGYELWPWVDYIPVDANETDTVTALVAAINNLPGFFAATSVGNYVALAATNSGADSVVFSIQHFGGFEYFQNVWPAEGYLRHPTAFPAFDAPVIS